MKCLYCGKKISFLRKLTDSEFCSEVHRLLYQGEQEKLALARLNDAGKRFSESGLFAPPAEEESRNGRQSAIKPVTEELKGFLALHPELRQARGFLRPPTEPVPHLADLVLPERRVQLNGEPGAAGEVDIPFDSKGVALVRPESPPAQVPFAAALQFPLCAVRWGTPGLPLTAEGSAVAAFAALGFFEVRQPEVSFETLAPATAGMLSLRTGILGSQLAALALSLALPEPASHDIAQQARAASPGSEPFAGNPILCASRLQPVGESVSVEAAVEPEQPALSGLLPLGAGGIASPAAPIPQGHGHEDFGGMLAVRTSGLEPVAPQPAAMMQEEPAHEVTSAPAPGEPAFAGLTPILPGEFVPPLPKIRKVRSREIFFSLPRLRDLPSLASRVARANAPRSQVSVHNRKWNPGLSRTLFPDRPLRPEEKQFVTPFGTLDPGVWGAQLPAFTFAHGELQIAATRETTVAVETQAAAPALAAVQQTPAVAEAFAAVPQHTRSLDCPAPFLMLAVATASEQPASSATTGAIPALRNCPPERVDAVDATRPQTPALGWSAGPGRLDVFSTLQAVEPSASLWTGAARAVDPERLDAGATLAPVGPKVPYEPVIAPPLTEVQFPLVPSRALADPNPRLAMQELNSLWPDSKGQLPRLFCDVEADSELREAVHLMQDMLREPAHSRWLAKLSLPKVSLPGSHNLKWLVMLAPVAVVLGVYSWIDSSVQPKMASSAAEPQAGVVAIQPPAQRAKASRRSKREQVAAVAPTLVAPSQEVAVVPASTATPPPNTETKGDFTDEVKQSIMRRAAISFSDDFRSGLADWEGRGDWSKNWAYDPAGFVTTGPLAFYKPTMSLSDYRMEFLGLIDRKSVGWVYRAQDSENYYATKITLVRTGPLPAAVVERYAVINGKESKYARRPLPLQIRMDTLYRVRMDVNGEDFTLTVQGQVVDHWSDSNLKYGGVGFFSAKGEQARLRWVEVSHQYDFLGKLCALLVPYQIPTKDGSLKQ